MLILLLAAAYCSCQVADVEDWQLGVYGGLIRQKKTPGLAVNFGF